MSSRSYISGVRITVAVPIPRLSTRVSPVRWPQLTSPPTNNAAMAPYSLDSHRLLQQRTDARDHFVPVNNSKLFDRRALAQGG